MTVIYDYFPDIYLKFLITQFLKIFPKYRKNFLKFASFKSFLAVPLNFIGILNICQFPQNFVIHTNFLETFESLFPQIIPNVRKNFTPYFHRIVRPKFACSLLLKFLNTYLLPQIISLCSTTSPPLDCGSLTPVIPSAAMIIRVRLSGEQS